MSEWVSQSVNQSFSQSASQSVSQSVSQSASEPLGQLALGSNSRSVSELGCLSVMRVFKKSFCLSGSHAVIELAMKLVNDSVGQSSS